MPKEHLERLRSQDSLPVVSEVPVSRDEALLHPEVKQFVEAVGQEVSQIAFSYFETPDNKSGYQFRISFQPKSQIEQG